MSNADEPAVPVLHLSQNTANGENTMWQSYGGLTKREYFAAMAMQGMMSHPSCDAPASAVAADAVEFADALLAELAKPSPDLAPALSQSIALVKQRDAYKAALEALEQRWLRSSRHHDCGDYERGYGQAEADIGQFSRDAIAKAVKP